VSFDDQRSQDSDAPSTTLRVVPSPLPRERMSEIVLAMHPHPSHPNQSHESFCLQIKREAERQEAPSTRVRIIADAATRPSLTRGAPAFRRSTAALHQGFTLGSAPGPRFLESPDPNGRTLSGTSAASSSRAGHAPADRFPSRPSPVCKTARGRRTRSTFRIASRKRPSPSE
jgi:hypothetical protein